MESSMKKMTSALMLAALFASLAPVHAQTVVPMSPDYWRQYTQRLPIGSAVRVRTIDGQTLTAVLTVVDDVGIVVQPKTRVPEEPRRIPFTDLAQVELKSGSSVGKAVAIGAATGAATFLGILLILAAAWD
jgi:hypothetical protein